MPDFKTSSQMELSPCAEAAFKKDPAAILTGIYTGDGGAQLDFLHKESEEIPHILNDALHDMEYCH